MPDTDSRIRALPWRGEPPSAVVLGGVEDRWKRSPDPDPGEWAVAEWEPLLRALRMNFSTLRESAPGLGLKVRGWCGVRPLSYP